MRRCRRWQPHPSQVEVQHRDATGPGQYPRAFDPKCNQKRITPAAAAGRARPRATRNLTPAAAAILGVSGCGDANAPAGRPVRSGPAGTLRAAAAAHPAKIVAPSRGACG